MIYAQTGIRPGESDAESSLGFWVTNVSHNFGQTTRPSDIPQKMCTWNNPQKIGKETGRLVNKKTSGNRPDNGKFKIIQNAENSPWDLLLLKFKWETIS